MDPMVGSSVASNGVSDSSDNAALLDFCFLCSRQFFHDNLDNYGTERLKDEDILEIFFEELGSVDRALLQCCPSCQTLCKTLTRTKEALSSLIDEITNLLLRSRKVSYLLSKSRVVSKLFQSSNISLPPCEVSSSYLQQPLSQLNFPKDIASSFPTQFNLRLDTSNLSDEDNLDLTFNPSSSPKRPVRSLAKCRMDRNNQESSFSVDNPCDSNSGDSRYSYRYNDNSNIMNSVCDNACDISETLKMEESPFKVSAETHNENTGDPCENKNQAPEHYSFLNSSPIEVSTQKPTKRALSLTPNTLTLKKREGESESTTNNPITILSIPQVKKSKKANAKQSASKKNKYSRKKQNSKSKENATKIKDSANTTTTEEKTNSNTKFSITNRITNTLIPIKESTSRKTFVQTFKCTLCEKVFGSLRSLKEHSNVHTEERKFICEICGAGYRYKRGLNTHAVIHESEPRFSCNLCSKTFSQKIGLQRHLQLHANKCQYVCDLCGKRFIHHSSLRTHKLVHAGTKNFNCPHCEETFILKSNLDRHIKTHEKVRLHKCPECKWSFAERYNLMAHMKCHDKSSMDLFECSECSKKYTRKFKLKRHMKLEHNKTL